MKNKYNHIRPEAKYIRVGIDYFKVICKEDRYGIDRIELKKWSKQEITQDHGKAVVHDCEKYDDFIILPDNHDYKSSVNGFYNLYSPFTHKPKEGKWYWTEVLLQHIFGEQYELGITYLQVLYLYPKQPLPVLTLISKERQTGKSTFIDWLMTIFGANMVIISPHDLEREFNGSYSRANIIAIEETLIEKSKVVEKVKALSTQKMINANLKNVNDFQIPFYGKIIIASNNERKFMKIDNEEIRFFIRKLGTPTIKNHNILNDMINEIPAFLHHLESIPKPDFSKSRMVFTADQLENNSLLNVKNESHTWLYKELMAIFEDYFLNTTSQDVIKATPKEIKDTFFSHNSTVTSSFIREVLLDEMKLEKESKNVRYIVLGQGMDKTGQPYIFQKSQFCDQENMPEKLGENGQVIDKQLFPDEVPF